jgi:hypothetical protein
VQPAGDTTSDCPAGDVCGGGGQAPVAPAITSASSTSWFDGYAGSFQIVTTGSPAPTCSTSGSPAGRRDALGLVRALRGTVGVGELPLHRGCRERHATERHAVLHADGRCPRPVRPQTHRHPPLHLRRR